MNQSTAKTILNIRRNKAMSSTNKVAIKGQFNTDNVFSTCGGQQEAKVDRESSLLHRPPRNWNAFCDAVDEALKPVTAARRFYKVYGGFAYVFLFGIILLNVLSSVLMRKYEAQNYVSIIFLPTIFFFLYAFCVVRAKISKAMMEVERICSQYSGNGVQYSLLNEHWGGCNKVCISIFMFIHVPISRHEMRKSNAFHVPIIFILSASCQKILHSGSSRFNFGCRKSRFISY